MNKSLARIRDALQHGYSTILTSISFKIRSTAGRRQARRNTAIGNRNTHFRDIRTQLATDTFVSPRQNFRKRSLVQFQEGVESRLYASLSCSSAGSAARSATPGSLEPDS